MISIGRKAHRFLSQQALLPLTRARALAKKSVRPVMLAYYEGLRFRYESAFWSTDRRRDWILSRLRFAVRRAYNETLFYRQRLDKIGFDPREDFSFEDFSAFPILEKDELRQSGKALLSNAIAASELWKDATGGSTGTPIEI